MLPSTPTARRPNLVDETSAALADHIFSEFAPFDFHRNGDAWLPSERELALRFGVSRPVIREAAKRLELQGLIEIHHGKGAKIVSQLHKPFTRALELDLPDPMDRLRQLAETRRLLEPESARLAALRATPEQVQQLLALHRKFAAETDLREAARLDVEFHHRIALAAGNRVIALILQSLGEVNAESRLRTLTATGTEKACAHHAAILAGIEAGDADEAARAMHFHVEEATSDLES